jgi:hypothetical protein
MTQEPAPPTILSDDQLVEQALANLAAMDISARQLLRITERMLEIHRNGYGRLGLEWWNGHLDRILAETSDKASQWRE